MKAINCPICAGQLVVKAAKGRKSNKPFIMLKCITDGRHFRGFITDQKYVTQVINAQADSDKAVPGIVENPEPEKRSLLDRFLNRNTEA